MASQLTRYVSPYTWIVLSNIAVDLMTINKYIT